ncbi:MAG TPA: hypothetical protein VKB39_03075 [Candidatus Baltobacteraceae bacterium]|nr:hypothetical protein [Candidatus Baltobacteraceae bacterium]
MARYAAITGGVVKIGTLEMKIARVEGFRVRVMWDSRNVRSDREGMPAWPYENAARDSWTVAKWRQERFVNLYPGFDVEVLDGDGNVIEHGRMLLETLRESYD